MEGGASTSFWVLGAFFVLLFFTGGSSRPDVASLLVLRPAAVLCFAYGVWTIRRTHLVAHKILFWFAAAVVALTGIHLVPLPPGLWGVLPGRDVVERIDSIAGLGSVWRPISMSPTLTWNALFSLFVPLAVLTNGAQLREGEHARVVGLLIVLAIGSEVISLLQVLGGPDSPFFLYRVTNAGASVGVFANRNHHAVYLASLFPITAFYVTSSRPTGRQLRLLIGGLAGSLALIIILISGSRSGLFAGVIGVASIAGVVHFRRRSDRRKVPGVRAWLRSNLSLMAVMAGAIALVLIAAISGRAASIQHALESDAARDPRSQIWPVVFRHLSDFLPMGAGAGSYERVFQVVEPAELLDSTYSNHAHNDWLEVVFTTGLPGALILIAATFAIAAAGWRLMRRSPSASAVRLARVGFVIVLLLALASLADYPLRVPIIAGLFVEACLWISIGLKAAPVVGDAHRRDHFSHSR